MARQLAEDAAVRLNYLNFTRSTEQTAILLSLMFGLGEHRAAREYPVMPAQPPGDAGRRNPTRHPPLARRRAWADRWAMASMMGYLYDSHCNARIVQTYPDRETIELLWGPVSAPIGHYTEVEGAGFDLDLVMCPCEGTRDLIHGYHGGSLSIVAGGPRGAFATSATPVSDDQHTEWYFVVTSTQSGSARPSFPTPQLDIEAPQDLIDVIEQKALLTEIFKQIRKKPEELLIATMVRDQPSKLPVALRQHARLRLFRGSSVAACLSVFFPRLGVDAFAGVVNPSSAILMAAAARSMGCQFYAIPARRPKRKDQKTPKDNKSLAHVVPGTRILEAKDLVPADDVFVVATGITGNLLLRGVRFMGKGEVATHTICLRSGSGSQRFITQHHFRDKRRFRLLLAARKKHTKERYWEDAYHDLGYDEVLSKLRGRRTPD